MQPVYSTPQGDIHNNFNFRFIPDDIQGNKSKTEDYQKLVIEAFKKSIHQMLLCCDIQNQSSEIVTLEKYVSDAINDSLNSNSTKTFVSLIDLYQIILVRLWLLQFLTSAQNGCPIKQHIPNILERTDKWHTTALYSNEINIQIIVEKLRETLKEITRSSPNDYELILTCFGITDLKTRELQNPELKDDNQLKISIFEEQSKAYISLEKLFLKRGMTNQALEISEARRSRTLVSILSKKLSKNSDSSVLIKSHEMQALALKLNTVFILYSFAEIEDNMNKIQSNHTNHTVWVISQNSIDHKVFSCVNWTEEMCDSIKLLQTYPYENEIPKGDLLPSDAFQNRLAKWYETLILPIEDYLPKRSDQTLTIVTEGILSQLPFAAFCDKNGKYLIEKCSIAFTPSIKVLELLSQTPHSPSQNSLVIGNPLTPNSKLNNLMETEREARHIVAKLLNTAQDNILTKTDATVSGVIKKLSFANWIHLACHGELRDKPTEKLDTHSVFNGFFRLASDENHSTGYLHAEKIASTALQTELVFMSACHSGRGNLKKEGVIGPNWSFLAAGARSTIATYWRLREDNLTVRIVETFYKHLLGKGVEKCNKAQALREAMLAAMKEKDSNPRRWAAFFLSGLDNQYEKGDI